MNLARGFTDTRTLSLVVPHWRTIAAGVSCDSPAVVLNNNQVVDVTPQAASYGIELGIRRREAQSLCPKLDVIIDDEARNTTRFLSVAAALESVTPRVEITTGGQCSFLTQGPFRYFGGDQALAQVVVDRVSEALSAMIGVRELSAAIQPRVGIADSRFAASLAAVSSSVSRIQIVPPATNADFLAPFSVDVLAGGDSPLLNAGDLVGVFQRLGLETLGDVASLPKEDLYARFGTLGSLAHRLSRGMDGRTPISQPTSSVVSEESEIDPPADHLETVVFSAKALASDIYQQLFSEGLVCIGVLIEVESDHGEVSSRLWRHEHQFTPVDITDRVRWQLEGWFRSETAPTGPLTMVRLVADEVIPDDGYQMGFWDKETANDERAIRSLTRIQGILGPDAVTVVQHEGGRRLADIEQRVPLAAMTFDPDRLIVLPKSSMAPWPGRLLAPLPAVVLNQAQELEVTDDQGCRVRVTGRGRLEGVPVQVRSKNFGSHSIVAWGGPWFLDERWWDSSRKTRQARFQFLLADGTAHLCVIENSRWWLEASYE